MQDIKLQGDDLGVFDIVIENGQISSVEGMETTILVSFFTDARAPSALVPDALLRRGWVGDILKAEQARFTGSHLWLLDQARMISRTFSQAEIYAQNAFKSLVEDGVANSVNIDIDTSFRKIDIGVEIVISENITERYNILWRRTNASGLSNI